jgi:hypothetical protein
MAGQAYSAPKAGKNLKNYIELQIHEETSDILNFTKAS